MRVKPIATVWASTLAALIWSSSSVAECPFDIDGANAAAFTSDGLAMSRFSQSIRDATMLSATGISASVLTGVSTALADRPLRFDVDGDGAALSATDALLIQRWLAGYRENALTQGIMFATNASRNNWQAVQSFFALGCPLAADAAKRSAARLLVQATFGPTIAEIDRVSALTPSAWVEEQFTKQSLDKHWDYVVVRKGPPGCTAINATEGCGAKYINAVMESYWLQAARGEDQLRQRLVQALHEFFVVSTVNSSLDIKEDAHASYLDMLSRNAFGNFRTLLEEVSLHPAMGIYLSHMTNEKEDAATGRQPDENYAREIMQLFSIGLWELNQDGSRRKDANGRDIPTYGQTEIRGMAKVFTGWTWGGLDKSDLGQWQYPNGQFWQKYDRLMEPFPQFHSSSPKPIVSGVTIPANTGPRASLRMALDALFNHPNTGPFLGSQLIKRFVTSNPSPAYVSRVSAAFANNGQGVRGDMKAVMRAVLLDQEARDDWRVASPSWGKLREPLVRFGNWLRAFDAKTAGNPLLYRAWNLEDPVSSIGQNPMRAPSVFNWFRPDYAPPGAILNSRLYAPEFQITHETTVTGYTNFVVNLAERGFGYLPERIDPDYSAELALASDPGALVDRLNLLLTGGQMSQANRSLIVQTLATIPVGVGTWQQYRVYTAIALIMASAEFIVQK
jgi:uncharacterized protein (DUF1800 family)